MNQFGQPRGDMTDADTTKKLKPAATVARSESLKDLSTLVCNVCGGDVWCKNDRWIGGYCVEKKVHVCSYCKKLVMQKQARLAKGESVNMWYPSSDKEEDAEESLVPKEIEESLIIRKNIHRPQMRLPMRHHLASDGAVPGCRVGTISAANISSALTTLIDVIERDWGVEGREGVSFHAREYWRPNRLVSFKTVATPVLFMGRRENIA